MTRRHLHLLGSIRSRLQAAQLDAMELATLDMSYAAIEQGDPIPVLEDLANSPQSMVIMDAETLADLIEQHDYEPSAQTILCATERENPRLHGHSEKLRRLRYLIGVANPGLMRSVLGSILDYQATQVSKGIAAYIVHPENLRTVTHTLRHSSERAKLQTQVQEFFTDMLSQHKDHIVAGTSSYPRNMSDILDELLMNAIWDACPARAQGDRAEALSLNPDETVKLECSFDGINMIVSITDSYGTFPVSALLKPLKYALGIGKTAEINEGPGGAGLGLYLILQKVAALSYEISAGKSTRAVAILRGDQSMRDLQKKPRTLLFFDNQ